MSRDLDIFNDYCKLKNLTKNVSEMYLQQMLFTKQYQEFEATFEGWSANRLSSLLGIIDKEVSKDAAPSERKAAKKKTTRKKASGKKTTRKTNQVQA